MPRPTFGMAFLYKKLIKIDFFINKCRLRLFGRHFVIKNLIKINFLIINAMSDFRAAFYYKILNFLIINAASDFRDSILLLNINFFNNKCRLRLSGRHFVIKN